MRLGRLLPFVAVFVLAASVHGDGQESFPSLHVEARAGDGNDVTSRQIPIRIR